jgi:hypothetical protein
MPPPKKGLRGQSPRSNAVISAGLTVGPSSITVVANDETTSAAVVG